MDYLLRTQQQNHVQLIQVADQKANIVLSMALLMITVAAGTAFRQQPHPALLVLVAGVVIAALPAIMALMPNLRSARWAKRHPEVRTSLLFFGHVAHMDADLFRAEMGRVLAADSRVYDAIVKDIHATSLVLERKYLWLRRSYLALLAALGAGALVGTVTELPPDLLFGWLSP